MNGAHGRLRSTVNTNQTPSTIDSVLGEIVNNGSTRRFVTVLTAQGVVERASKMSEEPVAA